MSENNGRGFYARAETPERCPSAVMFDLETRNKVEKCMYTTAKAKDSKPYEDVSETRYVGTTYIPKRGRSDIANRIDNNRSQLLHSVLKPSQD